MISKSRLIKTLGPLGGYALIRWLMRKQPRILMYHRFSAKPKANCVSADVFEQQLIYLKKHFNVISLSTLRECREHGKQTPRNSVVLTVDDGYRDFYTVAFPLLKKHEVPATLFVTSGFIDQELWLWPDKITWLLANAEYIPEGIALDERALGVCEVDSVSRPLLWNKIVGYLLSISDNGKHVWIEKFSEILKLKLPLLPPNDFQACSWQELDKMQRHGTEIGGHTHTHPSLGKVPSKQLHYEIQHCKALIDKNLGEKGRDFCFPNGQPNDYTEKTKAKVREVGFRSSVTAFYDKFALEDLYEMRRHVGAEENFQFWKSVNGVEAMMAKLTGANNVSTKNY